MKKPPIVLERSVLRAWSMDDAPALPKYANNRNVSRCLRDRFPHPYTVDDANEFLQRTTVIQPPINLCLEVNREVAGGIGIELGHDVHRFTGQFGYWLGEPFWGRGIMTEAVGAFIDYCFDRFQLRRIYAEAFSNNPASARVLEKNGFVLEGIMKNHVCKDGHMLDSLLHARTR